MRQALVAAAVCVCIRCDVRYAVQLFTRLFMLPNMCKFVELVRQQVVAENVCSVGDLLICSFVLAVGIINASGQTL